MNDKTRYQLNKIIDTIEHIEHECHEIDIALRVEAMKSNITTLNGEKIPCYRF